MTLFKKCYCFHMNADSDTQEIHIHRATYTPQLQKVAHDVTSICKKNKTVSKETKPLEIKSKNGDIQCFFDEAETRLIAAKLQNGNKNVCGICVSHLYYSK